MESAHQLESICKLRQRLVRLIKLGAPNPARPPAPTGDDCTSLDLTADVEECVRRLFSTSYTIEAFVQHVQQILHVTIKNSLIQFLIETIPLAHRYLQHDPYSWDTFKSMALPAATAAAVSHSAEQPTNRLPSLQQAQFRLPPSCPQLADLASSLQTALNPPPRSDADPYQQKLIIRFARKHFHLSRCGEGVFLQTLYNFIRYILRRVRFFAQHRVDTHQMHSGTYDMMSNVREQIRFLMDVNQSKHAERNPMIPTGNDQKRLTSIEGLRQREADETACLVLRESRLKRQKTAENERKTKPVRAVRANAQDLIVVMENETILRRSKTLLYAYANR